MEVKIFAEIVSSNAKDLEMFSEDVDNTLDVASENIFYKNFPAIIGRKYTVLVSTVVNGEVVSQDRRAVKVES